jgi:hypothetical protein
MSQIVPTVIIIVVALLAFVAGAVLARRRGYLKPGEVVVRCRRGHLFTTVWAARASRREIDLGWARIQRCPVGDHWTIAAPVDASDLTPEDKKLAAQYRDTAVPDKPLPSRPPKRRKKR